MIKIEKALKTSVTYNGTGSQTRFDFPFDYLRKSFVRVSVDNEPMDNTADYTIDSRTVVFHDAPPSNSIIRIYRETDTSRLVVWADASVLKASDMTIQQVQQLHILEEANDWTKTNSIVLNDEGNAWQGRNYRVSNVSDPTEAQDVVTKNYLENTEDSFVQRMNAIKTQTEQFANTAGNSKDSAYKSAQDASASAASAAESARLAEGYKTAAENAKSNASLYAANAKTSADNAGASKEAAQSAATTASNFASDARNSASEAKTYKDNAKTYMDNAKNYSENVNVFVPSVSSAGVLSWTNKAGLTNPASVNIKGAKGATGAAATITIGSVTTGAAGSSASVTNSGTASNVVLDFTLPRGKDGKDGADGGIVVDTELSDTSTNPVQNKVVKMNMDTLYNGVMTKLGVFSSKIPTKVSTLENDTGYLTMATIPSFPSTDSVNTWTARQTFKEAALKDTTISKARIGQEAYIADYMSGTAINPTRSTMCLTATGAVTLDMSTIVTDMLEQSRKNVTVFTAYITSTADYTLTLTNAGTIKYIGSASDVAITSAGLLLNIMMLKDTNGNVTSIVQASKLEGGA